MAEEFLFQLREKLVRAVSKFLLKVLISFNNLQYFSISCGNNVLHKHFLSKKCLYVDRKKKVKCLTG